MEDAWPWLAKTGSSIWHWFGETNPDTWAAAAGWTTVVIAIIASRAAFRQVREARDLREEQAQPYVVAFMEPSEASQHLIDLVIKNFGATAALNVTIECDPLLVRTSLKSEAPEPVHLFKNLPILVPGQEWRTFWDNGIKRHDSGLPEQYDVTVRYQDSRGKQMTATKALLDWGVYKSRMWTEIYGQHHAAKSLREISSTIKTWKEFGGGLKIYARDGDKKDERKRAENAEMLRRLEDLNSRAPVVKDGDELAGNE
ncbi:hypothetical protein AB0283_17420 [Micromonospora vinacea]|uniref:hypothetical protein n=1 Tax=Micromonospora vinacea TaxID=709878 RepID=UPI00344C956C